MDYELIYDIVHIWQLNDYQPPQASILTSQ